MCVLLMFLFHSETKVAHNISNSSSNHEIKNGEITMVVSVIHFACSLYYFFKFMGQALFRDVGSKVYGDYHSEARGIERSRA